MKHLFPLLAAVLLFWGCGHSNQQLIENAPLISRHFQDDLGREVTIRKTPKRVVSLAPSTTEMLMAIGGEELLVARSQACDYPSEVLDYPEIQTYPELDLAGIVAHEPDLVLATDEIFDVRTADFFDRYNIPLFFQSFEGTEDIYRNILTLGEMVDRNDNAKNLADSLRRVEKNITDSTAGQAKFSTMVLIGVKPLIAAGGKSFIGEIVEKAGGKNAFGHIDEKYPILTEEAILQARPEFILLPTNNDQVYQQFASAYPMLHLNMPASQNGRIYLLDPNLVLRPGPRTIEGLAYLARTLHARLDPESFFE